MIGGGGGAVWCRVMEYISYFSNAFFFFFLWLSLPIVSARTRPLFFFHRVKFIPLQVVQKKRRE